MSSSEGGWISVVGWDRFQHYADREVLWVKNYTRLLHDDDYLSLTLPQRAILHSIWLAYASARSELRADTLRLSRAIGARVTSAQLKALEDAGFIVIVASKSLASRYHDASARAFAERREEKRSTSSSFRSKTTGENDESREKGNYASTNEEEAESNNQSQSNSENGQELVRFYDGETLAPIGDTVEELRAQWADEDIPE